MDDELFNNIQYLNKLIEYLDQEENSWIINEHLYFRIGRIFLGYTCKRNEPLNNKTHLYNKYTCIEGETMDIMIKNLPERYNNMDVSELLKEFGVTDIYINGFLRVRRFRYWKDCKDHKDQIKEAFDMLLRLTDVGSFFQSFPEKI